MLHFADAVLLRQALTAADEGSPAAEQKLQVLEQVLSSVPEMRRYMQFASILAGFADLYGMFPENLLPDWALLA